jgi:hypothetical protein
MDVVHGVHKPFTIAPGLFESADVPLPTRVVRKEDGDANQNESVQKTALSIDAHLSDVLVVHRAVFAARLRSLVQPILSGEERLDARVVARVIEREHTLMARVAHPFRFQLKDNRVFPELVITWEKGHYVAALRVPLGPVAVFAEGEERRRAEEVLL